jgi:CubicO group peptidase (beta-lactamase class C family)
MHLMLSLFLFVFLVPTLQAQAPAPREDSALAANLRLYEIWVRERMTYYHQPAVSIGIVHDQDLVWAEGFGLRDVERKLPATTETVYRIASITKTFTATAIMQLRDAGKLRLDDPVKKHLPWLEYRDTFPAAPAITIEQLLTHTSGLPREADFPYWTDRVFPTRQELIAALETQAAVFEPATRYKYSNLGLALAGEVVAAVSGEPYAKYIQDHILSPLRMASTAVRTEDIDREKLATGYEIRRPDEGQPVAEETDSRALTAAANMSSNVEDLARFISLQFRTGGDGDSQILKGSTLREMHRVHWLSDDWSSGRGLGFSVWRQGERTLVGHGGWVAGYRTQIAFDPDAKIGVIVLTNSDEAGSAAYVRQAFELLAPAIERATTGEKARATAENLERYVGTYHDPSGWLTDVLIMDGGLVMYAHSYPPSTDLEEELVELTPVAEHTFRMTGENGSGELLIFEMRPDGRVARAKVGANYIFPQGCGAIDEGLQCSWREGER